VLPGDPAQMMLGQNEDSEQLKIVKQKYGFDKPLSTQYTYYLNDLSLLSFHSKKTSDYTYFTKEKYTGITLFSVSNTQVVIKLPYLRESFTKQGKKVSEVLLETLPNTFVLAISAIGIALILGMLFGVFSALYKDTFLDKVNISFTDSITKEKRKLEFGGNQVTEGMAYLSEQYNFVNVLPVADEYPYLIVQKLTETIYPEIIDDKLLIIVLCDISLMTYHPGFSFIRLLKYAKEIDITKMDLDDIYKECLEYIKGDHVDFDELVDNVKSEIKKNFNAEYYNDITNWIDIIFDRIKIIRSDIPSFFIDLVRFGKPNENNFFKLLLNSVGSPLVLNSESEGSISLPFNFKPTGINFNPGIFMALNQILRIFYSDKPSTCLLKDYCLKSKETDSNLNVDENCDIAPWKKAKEKNLCPVGQIWHHWALKDYYPAYDIEN